MLRRETLVDLPGHTAPTHLRKSTKIFHQLTDESHRGRCAATNVASLIPNIVPRTIQSSCRQNKAIATLFCALLEYCRDRSHAAFPSLQSSEAMRTPITRATGATIK